VGRLFTSFDEGWQYFLGRAEPLEWFFGAFPEDEAVVAEGWVIIPPGEIKQAALELQGALATLEWLAPVPEHFLHVWLCYATSTGGRPRELRRSSAFDVVYRRVNCFHSAVVVEVEAPQLRNLIAGTEVDASTFLPHMTIGVTRKEHDPTELRTALLPLRNVELGVGEVTELSHIRFPAAQTTLLRPWTVIETVPLSQNG
jgi:2'-5' RNA ligase